MNRWIKPITLYKIFLKQVVQLYLNIFYLQNEIFYTISQCIIKNIEKS